MTSRHVSPFLAFLLLATVFVAACSDSDDPADPGDTPDTTAPQVAGTDPANGEAAVAVDRTVAVTFNEPMAPATAAGQVTLSAGSVTSLNWSNNDRTLEISHGAWTEGAHVTVTLGTGLTDVAGNTLAAAYSFDFYVFTTTVAVLETNPADGATGVDRAANVQILFTREMDLASIAANTTISSPGKVDHAFAVSAENTAVVLDVEGDLPAETAITVTLGADVAASGGGTLGTPHVFGFTTGADVDVTPPTVVFVSPANGSTVAPDVGAFQVTFSEPMDPTSFAPSAWNAEFAVLMSQANVTPTWSGGNTSVSVPLPSPLPAGLPVEITFSDLTDANGVVQPTPWTWTGTVSGTPDFYPTADATEYVFDGRFAGGTIGNTDPDWTDTGMVYRLVDQQADGTFRLLEYQDEFITPTGGYELFRRLSNRLDWLGFADAGSPEVLFDAPLNVLPLPPSAGTWTGSTTVTIPGEGAYTADLNGTVAGPFDLPASGPGSEQLFYKGTMRVIRVMDVSLGGNPAFVQRDTIWYSPTLGPVRTGKGEDDTQFNEWSWERLERVLDFGNP